MPIAVVRGFVRTIPRLQAEEAATALQTAMMGNSANFSIAEVRRTQRDLNRTARGGEAASAVRPTREALTAMGIGVVAPPAAPAAVDQELAA